MRSIFTIVALLVATRTCHAANKQQQQQQQHEPAVLKWLLQQDGASFDFSKQRIVENGRVIFATNEIRKGSILATIPWSAMIGPNNKNNKNDDDDEDHRAAHFHCGTARAVWKELQQGADSEFAPYLSHLESQPLKRQLPSQYSPAAKDLLLEILGGEDSSSLLMERAVHYDFWEWKVLCGAGQFDNDDDSEDDDDDDDDDDDLVDSKHAKQGVQAAMWVQQHAFDDRMIPLKDFYTHRNGNYHNTDVQVVPGQHAQIVARRDIERGEQLHTSYTDCDGKPCTNNIDEREEEEEDYGTPGESS
jgi:hypothetical protein